jgi:4-hydroxy-tetrahydrodipicolinate reductase
LVGAVDVDPAKVGTDVGAVLELDRPLGYVVAEDLSHLLGRAPAEVALHATHSTFALFVPQILEILEAGLDIVSTAEELSFPWEAHPEEAAEIDATARRVGRSVLATGVNPGFIMDSLPLALTAICQHVDHIEVIRVIDAATRRGPFQAKIGCGLTVEEFEAKVAAGRMGHVGLRESIGMVCDTLGWDLAHYESSVAPLVAKDSLKTDCVEVQPGRVRGLRQAARGHTDQGKSVELTFVAALGADGEGDTIRIRGKPSLEVRLEGTNGDLATVAMVVNAIPRVREAAPGLITMRDLPIVTRW